MPKAHPRRGRGPASHRAPPTLPLPAAARTVAGRSHMKASCPVEGPARIARRTMLLSSGREHGGRRPSDPWCAKVGWWLGQAGERACTMLTIAKLVAVVSAFARSTTLKLRRRADEERQRRRPCDPSHARALSIFQLRFEIVCSRAARLQTISNRT